MAASGKLWALRMPGGPTRIIRSAVELSEPKAKSIYAGTIGHKAALVLRDKEAIWPLQKVIDETEFSKDYSQFGLLSQLTGLPRGIIEVGENGQMKSRAWPKGRKMQHVREQRIADAAKARAEREKKELVAAK